MSANKVLLGLWTAMTASLFVAMLLLLTSATARAQEAFSVMPPVVEQAPESLAQTLAVALQNGTPMQAVAAGILLLVALIGRLWKTLSGIGAIRPHLKWVALACGGLAGAASAMGVGSSLAGILISALLGILGTGVTAVGLNETFLKPILGLVSKRFRTELTTIKVAKAAVRAGSLQLDGGGQLTFSKK